VRPNKRKGGYKLKEINREVPGGNHQISREKSGTYLKKGEKEMIKGGGENESKYLKKKGDSKGGKEGTFPTDEWEGRVSTKNED